jgi:hypothetical protein
MTFGRNLRLDDGDLVFENRSLVQIEGIESLTQALTLRILTPSGSDRFNTGYGLDVTSAFTEPNGVRMVKELLKLNLVSTLGTDPRVREVKQVVFEEDPTHSRVWTVRVDLETVAETAVTLLVDVEV